MPRCPLGPGRSYQSARLSVLRQQQPSCRRHRGDAQARSRKCWVGRWSLWPRQQRPRSAAPPRPAMRHRDQWFLLAPATVTFTRYCAESQPPRRQRSGVCTLTRLDVDLLRKQRHLGAIATDARPHELQRLRCAVVPSADVDDRHDLRRPRLEVNAHSERSTTRLDVVSNACSNNRPERSGSSRSRCGGDGVGCSAARRRRRGRSGVGPVAVAAPSRSEEQRTDAYTPC